MRLIGYLLLTLTLLCQGAVARIHIPAEMPTAPAQMAMAEMDCHGHEVAADTMPCDEDFSCDGECGQCKVFSIAAAILPLMPTLPNLHGQRASAALPDFTSVTLFLDSPPPLV